MNFLEIINETLIELTYKPVSSFENLTKLDHKRIINVLNRINTEICTISEDFYFRQKKKEISLDAKSNEYNFNINGKISKILVDGIEFEFEPNYSIFYTKNAPRGKYSYFGKKLLFKPVDSIANIFYITNNFVKDKNDNEKENFTDGEDESIIPATYVRNLFVFGGAYNFKQNTMHPKYTHWKSEYQRSLSALIADARLSTQANSMINAGFVRLG